MSDEKSSYKQIFKATSIFGGVQVFTIIISIIRSKFIAVLLGPAGIGIAGLLNSSTDFIAALTNFGLERSAVKNIAAANGSGDINRIEVVVATIRKLVWYTGLLGAIVTFVFSSHLSELSFGNKDYTLAFVWLSITLLLNQLSAGQGVVLRGMRQLKSMAKASLLGSVSGLVISVPVYYKWGIKGIVPAILFSSFSTLFLTYFYTRKVKIKKVNVTRDNLFLEGKNMLSMGFVLSISSLIVLGESYLVRVYIRLIGSVEDVGFYNAGFAIVNTYFGVIFTSLMVDYYPRLAGVAHDKNKANLLMNQQSEMSVLILAPVLSFFLIFINLVVVILYSQKFLPISEMILWAAIGIYFKAASWSLGVIFISRGDVKTLFWSELFSTVVMLTLNLVGYKYLGLEGLGISFFLSYLFAFFLTFIIVKYKYSFTYTREFYKMFSIQLLLGILGFLSIKFLKAPYFYFPGIVFIILSTWYSLKHLEERLELIVAIRKLFKR